MVSNLCLGTLETQRGVAKGRVWSRRPAVSPKKQRRGLRREVASEKPSWLRVEGRIKALNKQR